MTEIEIKALQVGDRFKFTGFKLVWEVLDVVDRGLVLAVATGQGVSPHQHLEEWSELLRGKPLKI
jgi:hypothetical protein